MVEISAEDFMRALAFARAVKKARPKEDFFHQLIGRLGEMVFHEEARRALPNKDVGALNWVAMPKHVGGTGIDLRVNGWKVDVKTPSAAMTLDWPACKRSDLFPGVALERACLAELAARYKNPAKSTPIGLLDDPIVRVRGEVVGWIGIGSAERLADDAFVTSYADGDLASAASLWALLVAHAGPDVRLADAEWQKARAPAAMKPGRGRRMPKKADATLLPPRRRTRAASAA